jgi:hypothetical protein
MDTYRIKRATLGNVLRFTSKISEIIDARTSAPAAETPASSATPTTAAEMYSDAGQQMARAALAQTQSARMIALFTALVQDEQAVEVARLILEHADGSEIPEGADADDLPCALFCEAWEVFMGESERLTSAALGLPSGLDSRGALAKTSPSLK